MNSVPSIPHLASGGGEFQLVKMVKIGPKVDFRWVWLHFL